MKRLRKVVQAKPAYLIKFMRFAVFNFLRINFHSKEKLYPMCFTAILFAKDVSVSEKFITYIFYTVFFFQLFAQSLFDGISEINSSATDVPPAVFIAAVLASLVHQVFPISIMAKIRNSNRDIINSFFHTIPSLRNDFDFYPTKECQHKDIQLVCWDNADIT